MAKLGPGARVGDQFHLIRKIGEGGCGEVYLAEQTTLGRNTVVKLMHPELSRDASYVARFQREARLAARLIHHHTAAIYAFGETPDKVLWIAMEYIEGESLHNVLARDNPRQLAELLAPVADVLDRAASMGIIHRDVKPDNILVAPDGDGRRAVLLDFGLARPKEDNDKLTAVGVAVGSPTYMSPEQVFGPSVDSATDRYALGIILYIAVAKRPPFRHDDRVQLVLMHKRNPVPLLNGMVPAIPPNHPLDQFFAKALAKQPTERFRTAREMIEEFVRALDAQPLQIFGDAPVSTGRTPLIRTADNRPTMAASPPPPQPRRRRHRPMRELERHGLGRLRADSGHEGGHEREREDHERAVGHASHESMGRSVPSARDSRCISWTRERAPAQALRGGPATRHLRPCGSAAPWQVSAAQHAVSGWRAPRGSRPAPRGLRWWPAA